MALPNSNAIKMSQVKSEIGSSANNIRTYSDFWGLTAPDSMSEFYGKTAVTFTASRSGTFTRNNCTAGYTAGSITFSKSYSSTISQSDADNKKANDTAFNTEGQAYANTNATCTIPAVTMTYNYGCTGYLNTGYITVTAMGGGLGGPYVWQWKLEGGTYSANKALNTSATGLANGLYYVKVTDQTSGTFKEDMTLAIGCSIQPVTATITGSYVDYEGSGTITVGTIIGGDGSGAYYWYTNTDATQRQPNTTVSNLADGEYIVFLKDANGNGSSTPVVINAPVRPNATLQVRFKTSSFAIGECGSAGSVITVELNSPYATFDNATTFTSSVFAQYGQGTFGYINYGSKYLALFHSSNNTVAQVGGSRLDCTYHPVAGTDLGPACNGFNYQNRSADGSGGVIWGTIVTANSSSCGYNTPSGSVFSGCTGYIGTGYITVNSITGGTGSPYTWKYKLDGGSYSAAKANNTTASSLPNGSYQVRVFDKDGNYQDYTSIAIGCNAIPAVTATITASYSSYEGSGYILVSSIAGGDGSGGYYWFTNFDGTARAAGTQISNLADGTYTITVKDSNGNQSVFERTIDAPPVPNANLSVRFKTTAYGLEQCGTGASIQVTLSSSTATFENSTTFTSSAFTAYGQGVFGYINYGSRWIALYHTSNNATATPGGSRQDCSYYPAAGTSIGAACNGYALTNRIADGSGGYTWGTIVENNSSQCGYDPPAAGTYVSHICVPDTFTKRVTYNDGAYGFYTADFTNSTDCGYEPPPADGTLLSGYLCSGIDKYQRLANGSGGDRQGNIMEYNSADCGYQLATASVVTYCNANANGAGGIEISNPGNGSGEGYYAEITPPGGGATTRVFGTGNPTYYDYVNNGSYTVVIYDTRNTTAGTIYQPYVNCFDPGGGGGQELE